LGDVKGSEGVEGLQRAFKMAGVKKIMVSLWPVPDRETTEFMISFYQLWMSGKEIQDAFYGTQLMMRKKYQLFPIKWAGFALIE
jgi:CHAT domain-containing protein